MNKKYFDLEITPDNLPPPLPQKFYLSTTLEVAKELLGCLLVRKTELGFRIGLIVETEAYIKGDPANHATKGKTKRNAAMFGPPGSAYIYRIHQYYCFNVVTQAEGQGEAVLIRAVQPLWGIELMQKLGGKVKVEKLCNGPGKLCRAFSLDSSLCGKFLDKDELYISQAHLLDDFPIMATKRIGISTGINLPYRFIIADNPYLSRKVNRPQKEDVQ